VRLRALVPVVLTLALAACTSTQTVAPTTTTGTGVVTRTANLSSLERQELAAANTAWAGVGGSSPPSLVGPAVQLSQNAGFVNGDASLPSALAVSRRLRGSLRLRRERDAGHHLRAAGFRLLAPPVQGMYAGPPDRVLSVHRGTDIWETAHGTMRFPAWLFTVSGLKGTASVLALSPSDLFQPRHVSEPPPGSSVSVGSARLGDGVAS